MTHGVHEFLLSIPSTAGPRSVFGYCDAKEYVILSDWCV